MLKNWMDFFLFKHEVQKKEISWRLMKVALSCVVFICSSLKGDELLPHTEMSRDTVAKWMDVI